MSALRPLVVITGASKGIGLAAAQILLHKFNADVLSISRSRTPQLDSLAEKYPSNLHIELCDITDKPAITTLLTSPKYPHIDALILNAGAMSFGRIASDSDPEDEWRKIFDINFFSLLYAVRAALPKLRASKDKGRIVFMSSGAAIGGIASWGAYNASKAAMNSLCRTLASEEPGVISVALRPGRVDTDMQKDLRENGSAHMTPKEHADFVDAFNKGELVKPEDAGHVAAALSLNATQSLSGKFFSWNEPDLAAYRA
ncbi:hypothetical protein M422DRAFT_150205 [Sphaerobolus stellatus SS14]|nr:hypothetical protein M422DRAFT_150205 [Sphaerobolus stellatus SS14]